MQIFSRKFIGQCGLLHHEVCTGIAWLGLKIDVRLQLWCD